jgi:hypothetical protein
LGSKTLSASNVFLTGSSLNQSLKDINNQKAFSYITNKSWHFSTTTFEKTGTYGDRIYTIDREIQSTNGQDNDQLFTPIKIPSTIFIPPTLDRGLYNNTVVTGFYDLYFGALRGGGLQWFFRKATDRKTEFPYGYSYYELNKAYSFASDSATPPYYYFYGKVSEDGQSSAIISYNAVKNNGNTGIWTLYRYNHNESPQILLLNTYQSGQVITPDTIPLSNWFSNGNWSNPSSPSYNASLVNSLNSLNSIPDISIGNVPNFEPAISSQRMRYINVDVPIDGLNPVPGGFLPVYY